MSIQSNKRVRLDHEYERDFLGKPLVLPRTGTVVRFDYIRGVASVKWDTEYGSSEPELMPISVLLPIDEE